MFQERLKSARTSAGLSQKELAKRLFISQQAYAKYETGTSTPNPEAISKIAFELNVSTDFLLGRSEDTKNTAPETDADKMIYMFDSTDENIVLISRKNGKRKKYILTDSQVTVVESLLSEFQSDATPLPGSLVAEGGEGNKSGRRRRKPTI